MSWLKQLLSRRTLLRDHSEEIQDHLDPRIEALVAEGYPEKRLMRLLAARLGM